MLVASVLALVSLMLLTLAVDHLVLGASRLATRLRLSPVAIGVIVIGLGTSAPEFLVSGVAAASGETGIAVGNIAASNILNLTLIHGVASIAAQRRGESDLVVGNLFGSNLFNSVAGGAVVGLPPAAVLGSQPASSSWSP